MKKTISAIIMLIVVLGCAFAAKTGINLWYSIGGEKGAVFQSIVAKYQSAHPELEINLVYTGSYSDTATKVSAAKVAGGLPDMVITSASQLYTIEDGDYSMESNIKDSDFNVSDINSGVMDYAKFLGHTGAVPFAISTPVIYYNKDLVKKAGYDLEKNPPKTWDEFLEMTKSMQLKISELDAANSAKSNTKKSKASAKKSSTKITVYGFDVTDTKWLFKSMLAQNGCSIAEVDKSGKVTLTFANDAAVEVGNYWARLCEEGVMEKGQHDAALNRFNSGNLIFYCASSAKIADLYGQTSFEVGAIEMPYFKKPAVALGGSTATIFSKDQTKHKAAWELLKFLINTDNQAEFAIKTGYLPIRKSSQNLSTVKAERAKNAAYDVAIKELDYAFAYAHFGAMGSLDSEITSTLEEIEFGSNVKKMLQDAVKNVIEDM